MVRRTLALLAIILTLLGGAPAEPGFDAEKFGTEGVVRVENDASGQQVASLLLDKQSGAGFFSKQRYLYGEFSVQMKLMPGNTAGTVTCFYLTSDDEDDGHDEIDMEFMGNTTGDPVILNTNVWANGDGKKEHQFNLWFDPAADFRKYTIIWNPKNIIFQVDDVSVRVFKRYDDLPYPETKPMGVHATLWDGSFWATRKGEVKIDWSHAPFIVAYREYSERACVTGSDGRSSCPAGSERWMDRVPDDDDLVTVAWAKRNCLQYNYCEDGWRFPQALPGECSRN